MIARLTLALCVNVCVCFAVDAQVATESSSQPRAPIFDVGEIEVPEGNVADVLEFLEEMTRLQKDIASDYRKAMTRVTAAQAKASNQILDNSDDVTDQQFAKAASFGLATRVRGIMRAKQEEQRKIFELVKRQLTIGVENGLQRSEMSNASTLASYLERYGDSNLAAEAYSTFADLLKDVKNPAYKRYVDRFEGSARRLALLGNPIELTGKLLDGSDFDWDSYQGKVVLIDFWATWCGPCIAEAPNVRKQYDLYHDLGFEVVGISLDTKKSALEAYVKKENVPWVNLFQDGAGWKHAMAVKYGVSAIPTVFLVGRDGNVVSLRARGSELGKQLAKLLNTKADWERAIALYNDRITPETTDAELISRRAAAYTATEQWDLARADWVRATELQPKLIQKAFSQYRRAERWSDAVDFGVKYIHQKPSSAIRWLSVAPCILLSGDNAAFREHCEGMISQFRETTDGRDARLTCKTCLLLPDAVDPEELPRGTIVKLTKQTASQSAWSCSIGAMLAYRSGDLKLAAEYLEKSGKLRPVDFAKAANLPMLAMVQHKLGDHTSAQESLQEAAKVLDRLRADDGIKGHHDLLIADILFREAETMIKAKH